MDDLLREFLTETSELLDVVDIELVKFEQDPNNAKILDNIFRLVHTIKGTCGFLGLPRLEAIAHAAETLMGKFRDGARVNTEAVSLVLSSIDRIKVILGELERTEAEPDGDDTDIISQLEALSEGAKAAPSEPEPMAKVPERELRPGEVSEEELERAFRETPGPDLAPANAEPRTAERELRPGEASEEELERAFRETRGPELRSREPAPAPRTRCCIETRTRQACACPCRQ